jgi:hypothetical protein
MTRSKNSIIVFGRRILFVFLFVAVAVPSSRVLSATEAALSYDAKIKSSECRISFPSKADVLNQLSSVDFCGRSLRKDQVSGWSYFTNKGGWPQSFMTTITTGSKENGYSTFIVEFSNSGAHTSFIKSFAKWLGGLDPY